MPTVAKLAKLFQAIATRDFESAEQIAKQIAASEDNARHHSAAQLLRGSLQSNGIRGHRPIEHVTGIATNGNFMEAALNRKQSPTRLKDVMLRPDKREALDLVIRETRYGDYLNSRGLRRRSKLLFVGPPGCGKSFAAQAVANELELPHYVVRFDAVIGAYLGQTATHLRELFRFAANTPCVLLFDEIDALGKQRGNPLDVGELDRIVIALMQELEFLDTKGIVIATSNLPKNLDHALWRRFDLTLEFPKPTRPELVKYTRELRRKYNLALRKAASKQLGNVHSYADAERLIEAEARRVALRDAEQHVR